MPDYDDWSWCEPAKCRRKYKITDCDRESKHSTKRWTILLSVVRLNDDGNSGNESPTTSPLAGSGPGGHKASFRSTKLARRARSFKDDFLGKISQMRSPGTGACTASLNRSHSPKGTPHKYDMIENSYPHNKGPIHELDYLRKQIQIALRHFRDVVTKNKLEMLPGNGTIILDTVWMINLAVKSSVSSDSSSSVMSATNHMYQSVARLIKLCDDALIDDKSTELHNDNVNEIVSQVEDAVESLITLAQEKISHQQKNYKTTPRTSYGNTSLEMSTQRNSLPDIPLTPREMEILEQTNRVTNKVRSSHSTESILRDLSPPPKPPLPEGVLFGLSRSNTNNSITPPPLPPKKKNKMHQLVDECSSTDNSPNASSLERVSIRSKSPEEYNSLHSASAGSLDSILNRSRDEEEEIKAIMDPIGDNLDNPSSDIFNTNSWEESSLNSSLSAQTNDNPVTSLLDYHRLSNADSGIMSSHSYRSSSYSKRSSQQSCSSTQWGMQQQQHIVKQSNSESRTESLMQNLHKNFETTLTMKNFTQKSSSSMVVKEMTSSSRDEIDFGGCLTPPAIPQKTRKKQERQPSPYDNVPDSSLGEVVVTCQMHQSQQSSSSSTSITNTTLGDGTKPPPLPPKKKHMFQSVAYSVMAYMEMIGNCSHTTTDQEFMRHSVHMVNSQWGGRWPSSTGLPTAQSCSFSHSSQTSNVSSRRQIQSLSTASGQSTPNDQRISLSEAVPPALPPKQRLRLNSVKSPPPTPPPSIETKVQSPVLPDLLEHTTNAQLTKCESKSPTLSVDEVEDDEEETTNTIDDGESNTNELDLMEELNAEKYLILKKSEEDGPDIRGGPIDALIIQATKATKNVFIYQEAFLTTYRTFITPNELINKLIRRYNHFYYQPDKKPRSREAFALMVRVVSDLTASDLNEELQSKLMQFVQQLISCGELTLAKALRVKHLERLQAKQMSLKYTNVVTSLSLSARNTTLLDFKSEQIAEQMTLLDAELFMKIEIPEVLIWAQEQNEERSPNLTRFTEHFNKMSYWARTKILTAESRDIRERYFLKFIKIMKHLRKINNFNSYLALLSALDSAPVRRLEWQKHVQEGLKEYCALIDSSSSFRAYRQALAETHPPCIPYIGLVLQDLTFVHIGNSNYLNDGIINFSKRWQQFNIVENMKKFKQGTYLFKKNERIIQFFQNFDDFIGEDAMWQLSESIKPRGGKKTT